MIGRTLRPALLLLLLLTLTSCGGTFAMGLEQTPTPDPAPQATLQALTDENARLSSALATALAPAPPPPTPLGRIAYIRGGDLWVTVLPDGPHQRLTIDGHNREPHWSASGEWIAYRKDRTVLIDRDIPCQDPLRQGQPPCRETVSTFQQQVWLARRSGADQHVINRGLTVERFAWSPTNDLLAYITEAGALQTLDPATDISLRLVASQADGRVTALAWSPDGLRVAYQWLSDEQGQPAANPADGIWVIPTTGGQATRVVRPGEFPAILAQWRDSEHLMFWQLPRTAGQATDNMMLYSAAAPVAGVSASTPEPLANVPMLPRTDFVAVAATEQHAVAAAVGAGLPTWTNKRVVAGRFETSPDLAAITPAWSPDGESLAFVAMPDAPALSLGEDALTAMLSRHIWVAPVSLGPAKLLTDDVRYRDERPLWSRQGSHLLFARITREGQASLWLLTANGGQPALVVDELTPAPDPIGTYGYIDWAQHFDWWRG